MAGFVDDPSLSPQKRMDLYKTRSRTLEGFGYEKLMEYGFIDYKPPPMPPVTYNFLHDYQYLKPYLESTESSNPSDLLQSTAIHPVFQRASFKCNDANYNRLRPALSLASSFISEPAMLAFFEGLMDWQSYHTFQNEKLARKYEEYLKSFTSQPLNTDANDYATQASTLWKKIAALKGHVEFRITQQETDGEKFMTSDRRDAPGGLVESRPNERASDTLIWIAKEYIEVLRNKCQAALTCPLAADHDPEPAHIRSVLLLACSLFHEITHAIFHAYVPYTDAEPSEPFYNDDFLAEVGWAAEQVLFRGIICAVPDEPLFISCPYGLALEQFPNSYNVDTDSNPIRGTSWKFGYRFEDTYAVHMKDVHKFFTRDFWSKDVPQYGLVAYRPKRIVGVRYNKYDPKDKKRDLSPTMYARRKAHSPPPEIRTAAELDEKHGLL